ncbi:MAG TPA: LysE family transporter [Noviherbaspirillum sp.]|jgi:L-lysine exporter family protein LysE/ArgO|uniref:LysE/ArgO family amino acid transporter n=1 Tax=Noviherbaspirillum sp. TaxID=1926288 RepID=UPI002DDD5E39|nr:LysE family transporter [Noviherbaspirillum sp.]HEV2612734.1 LysE family transporter [Noviherbaspirillum sp.]
MPSGVSYLQGLTLGIGLMIAIGPKDVFVIRQSLRGRYLLAMMSVCVGADALLIFIGTAGVGTLVSRYYWLMMIAVGGGAAFMCWHGYVALKAAMRPTLPGLEAPDEQTLSQVVIATTAMSFLNPLAILDTAVLIGAVSGTKPMDERVSFALGALSASFLWFSVLIGGARLIAPLFMRPIMWQVLDFTIAVIMFAMAWITVQNTFWS